MSSNDLMVRDRVVRGGGKPPAVRLCSRCREQYTTWLVCRECIIRNLQEK